MDSFSFSEAELEHMQAQLEVVRKELEKSTLESEANGMPGGLKQESKNIKNLYGSSVRVDEDEMTAWLYLQPPLAGQVYTVEMIKDFLRSQGVLRGMHESNIQAMAKKAIYEKEVIVALGEAAVPGKDGYYEYLFSPTQHKSPEIRENGTADYTSMSMLQNVGKDEKIAIYHPAVQGIYGYNIRGEEEKPKPARELPPIRGKNISRLEDGVTYISLIDGKVEVRDGRVDVQNIHEIVGDVTLIVGRIEFYGDVIIRGNVEAGVVIRAGRNIVISGIVESVSMYAGGDIILTRGINGGGKAKLSARGNLFADYIENANVKTGGDVQANSIINSNVSAEGRVTLDGKRGALIGGYTHGLLGIEATSIGNESETKTIVHAGYDTRTYEKYLRVHKKEKEIQEEVVTIVDEMTRILRERRTYAGKMKKDVEQKLLRFNQRKEECFSILEELKSDKEFLRAAIEKGKGATIQANGPIYRGVIVGLETVQFPIERSTSYMKYSVDNGVIMSKVIIL